MSVQINGRKIGPGQPCYFIAEIGINHNGSLPMALDLVDAAVEAGAQAVKFQKRDVRVVYSEADLKKQREVDRSIIDAAIARQKHEGITYEVFPPENLARLTSGQKKIVTTNGDLKYALEFGIKEFDYIQERCEKRGISWSASAWDGLSAHFINGFDVHWLKIASPCLTHLDLLKRVKKKKKPIILSTGGSTLEQVKAAVDVLGTDDLILLHCVSIYPPKDEDTNLKVMQTLRELYPEVPVGYSSHSTDILPPIAAAGMGAAVIEAHLTLDQSLPGSDHKASLTPLLFSEMVRQTRRIERDQEIFDCMSRTDPRIVQLIGDGVKRVLPDEVKTMEKLRRVDDLPVSK